MLKLYGGTRTRASIIEWYLQELGIPYEFVLLDMQSGEHLQPEYLKLNPMGKVPALVDGDFQIWESGAILLYLADKYGKTPLSPEERGVLSQWVFFANATLGPGIFGEENRKREMTRLLTPLNNIFEQQPFLLGNEFSVADVAVGSILNYFLLLLKLDLSSYPAVLDYIKRISERPAFSIGKRA
ncbi:glutathione S-transferase-like protein [Calothrix sp. NIES-2100]|uniref:glutathione S-transferase family protein n=1 Tax=Calothrix sp. NIES-2100 TaxID=1954172 RepID=UPI000B616D10|nr:glutathione S-transferase-like protein [Calothrix sp. NIES-2100]